MRTVVLVLLLAAGSALTVTSADEAHDNPEQTQNGSGPVTVPRQATNVDLSNMAVAAGYRLEVDSVGYDLPTAIAVVPEPFADGGSPAYFVAELQGTIKVVTRDRTVHDFATVPTWGRQGHDLAGNSQQGLAGLCLAPEHGYLFATFTEPDDGGVLRNRIVRFTTTPTGYGLAPRAVTVIAPEISSFQSAPAHQIGDCEVHGERLFVGIGDGGNPKAAADPAQLLGKVLCLTLDGLPCPDAPYGLDGPAAFVHASGFRNPFGLAWQGGRLHAVENGVNLDRFLPVTAGRDHLWNGTDEALASLAEVIFPNPFAPVQLTYVPAGAAYMDDDWSGQFVAAGYGSKHVSSGVAAFAGEPSSAGLATPPRYLIEYLGPPGTQHFAGVAAANDGLYVTPMLPLGDEPGVVLRLVYDPGNAHLPTVTKASGLFRSPELGSLNERGCTGCHAVAGNGGGIGPNLDRFGLDWRITQYLNSTAYADMLTASLDTGESGRDAARRRVLAATGSERTWVWIKELLLDPRFDDPQRQMPDLGLSVDEAETVRADLYAALKIRTGGGPLANLRERLSDNLRPLLAGALAGAATLLMAMMALELLLLRWRRRVSSAADLNKVQPEATGVVSLSRGTDQPLPTSSGEYR